jgi:hypothetical protein
MDRYIDILIFAYIDILVINHSGIIMGHHLASKTANAPPPSVYQRVYPFKAHLISIANSY